MSTQRYKQIRASITFFIAFVVSIAVVQDSYLLAAAGVVTGMLFSAIVRSKAKHTVDEREKAVREKAAHMAYAIFAPTIGIGAFFMLLPSLSKLSVFSKGDFTYLESLGIVFAYLSLFLITVYSISYHFINKQYGGVTDEE